MTQEEVALRLNVETSTITKYEKGQRTPSLAIIEHYASVLQVRPSTLFGEVESEAFSDAEAARNYNALPSYLKPVARATLRALNDEAAPIIRSITEDRRVGSHTHELVASGDGR